MSSSRSFQALEPLIQSEGGLHFSAYIANYFGAPPVRSQIEEAIKVASEDIRPVLSREDRKKFLRPIHELLTDGKTLSTIRGNIGIFRSKNFFRVLHVPVHVEEFSTVASSFHVKPLLRWMQDDRAFRLVIAGEKTGGLYFGTQHSLRHMDSFVPKKSGRLSSLVRLSKFWEKSQVRDQEQVRREFLAWLEARLSDDPRTVAPPLFVVGSQEMQDFLSHHLPYADMRMMDENGRDLAKILAKIRGLLREEAQTWFLGVLRDFRVAEALDRTESNVFRIAKAAKRGLVKKLFVAADRKLFGKLHARSGSLTLHPADIDHEDEDVLDDIAQTVVRRGGEVLVVPARKIPGGHSLLAISEPEDSSGPFKAMRKFRHQKLSFGPA
jgi:hypothetical protein